MITSSPVCEVHTAILAFMTIFYFVSKDEAFTLRGLVSPWELLDFRQIFPSPVENIFSII